MGRTYINPARPKSRRGKPEALIQGAIIDWLQYQENVGRCWFWRQNNIGTYDPVKGVFRSTKKPGHKNGVPDILVCIGGRMVGFECKSASGGQSPQQKLFEQGLVKAGGYYFVVRCLQDAERAFAAVWSEHLPQ